MKKLYLSPVEHIKIKELDVLLTVGIISHHLWGFGVAVRAKSQDITPLYILNNPYYLFLLSEANL